MDDKSENTLVHEEAQKGAHKKKKRGHLFSKRNAWNLNLTLNATSM